MKFGFDIHGVINEEPLLFSELTKKLKSLGHEIHILTGPRINIPYKTRYGSFNNVMEELDLHNIVYDKLFSILDHNINIGNNYKEDESGFWIDQKIWDSTKGNYCKENEISLHIDDTRIYSKYFDNSIPFIHLTPISDVRTFEVHNPNSISDFIISLIEDISKNSYIFKNLNNVP